MFLSSFPPWNSVSPRLWGLGRSDSERCCYFSSVLLENNPSFSQQVDLYGRIFVKPLARAGGFHLTGKILCKEIQSKVHWGLNGFRGITFRTSTQTFNDSDGSLQKKIICLSFQIFLFQQLANMGGLWKKGWKKVSPPQETPMDRPDRRLDKAREYFINSVRLLMKNLQRAPFVDRGAEYGSASVSLSPGTRWR